MLERHNPCISGNQIDSWPISCSGCRNCSITIRVAREAIVFNRREIDFATGCSDGTQSSIHQNRAILVSLNHGTRLNCNRNTFTDRYRIGYLNQSGPSLVGGNNTRFLNRQGQLREERRS